jgi:hypothetical protein
MAAVRELEAGGRGLDDIRGDRERQAALATRLEELAQRRAVHELHDEEDVLAVACEVEDRHDVAVLHTDQQLGLADQALDKHVVGRELGEQALDRDRLLEPVRAHRVTGEHLGHATAPEQVAQDVAALSALRSRLASIDKAHLSCACSPGHERY